eukprot:TRINITY_DN17527_c0_g1_i1.p1 TRINITY_DN17527_c0_g1~~TRINITY_DN17527_c0_g1_i1.p1  ORF type:complete len:739 (-),score=132.88 TRINITY_DN17527_c0_g1_i1:73-2235(-)
MSFSPSEEQENVKIAKQQEASRRLMVRNVPPGMTGTELAEFLGRAILQKGGHEEAAEVESKAWPVHVCGIVQGKIHSVCDAWVAFWTDKAATVACTLDGIEAPEPADGPEMDEVCFLKFQRPAGFEAPPGRIRKSVLSMGYPLIDLLGTEGMLTRREEELEILTEEKSALLREKSAAKESVETMLDLLKTSGRGPEMPPDVSLKEAGARPEFWGLRVSDILEFSERILEDINAYCGAHKKWTDPNGNVRHACLNEKCSFDHRGVDFIRNSRELPGKKARTLHPDMNLVVDRYIRPETLPSHTSFALMTHAKRPLLVNTFVSHAWNEDFVDFVSSLQLALDSREVVFVSSFSINQNTDPTEPEARCSRTPTRAPFAQALRGCRQICVLTGRSGGFAKRLWCCSELHMSREWRIPTWVWPSANGDLDKIKSAIEQLDVERAYLSNEDDRDVLLTMLEDFGALTKVSARIRQRLQERLNLFMVALQELQVECKTSVAGAHGKDMARLRQRVVELERDTARKDWTLHGDLEFGELAGALFGYPSYVPEVRDAELMRDVFYVNGVCSFKCSGTMSLAEGAWRVGFAVKCDETLNFSKEVVLQLNGVEKRRLHLETELSPESGWVMLEVGEYIASDEQEVELTLVDADFEAPESPVPKRGLFLDRVVARRTTPGMEGEPGRPGGAPPLFIDPGTRGPRQTESEAPKPRRGRRRSQDAGKARRRSRE